MKKSGIITLTWNTGISIDMILRALKGFRAFWPIDAATFALIEPWSPYIFMDPPPCPACHTVQGGLLIETHYRGGTLWTCFKGCGQRYWTNY